MKMYCSEGFSILFSNSNKIIKYDMANSTNAEDIDMMIPNHSNRNVYF